MSDPFAGDGMDYAEPSSPIPAQLRDPLGVFKRGWRWALVAFLLLAAPAVVVAQLVPLQYEAGSRLLMTAKRIPDEYVPTTIIASGAEQFQAIKEVVFTREKMREIVATTGIYAKEADKVPIDALANRLRGAVAVDTRTNRDSRGHERSISIRVSLRGEEPEQIAAVVNDITGKLIEANLEYRSQQSKVTSDFMRREYERADEALRAHQRKLASFRETHRGSLPEEQTASMAKLERLEQQRRSIILQINEARLRLSNVQSSGVTTPVGQASPLEAKRAELQRLLALYTEEHPQVLSVQRQIRILEGASPDSAGSPRLSGAQQRDRIEQEIASREERLAEIDRDVSRIESLIARTSEITEDYSAMQRDEVVLVEAYNTYLRKLKNAELSRSMEMAQQGSRLVRLESAIPPRSPVLPRSVFTAAGLVVAFALSLVVAVLREILNPVVIDEKHLESLTSLPTLGSIPRIA